MKSRVNQLLFSPQSGASLAVLRLGYGVIMLYEALWFLGLTPNAACAPNLVESMFTGDAVQWTFSYPGLAWARPLPEPWTTAVFVALAIASGLLAVGFFSRLAAAVVFLTFGYINAMDASMYLNHFYLACLIALLFVVVPADRRFSISSLWRRRGFDATVPSWSILLFRAQVFLVYFYAGIAKLNGDWLVGEPLRRWLPHPSTLSKLESLLGHGPIESVRNWLALEGPVLAISYAGLVFDLSIGFLLAYRPTRRFGLLLAILFHASNFFIFSIGAFPVMAVILTTVFLDPQWPDRVFGRIAKRRVPQSQPMIVRPVDHLILRCLLTVWLGFQLLVPLRHFVIPGNVSWTEEGHRFSWRMKLRDKYGGPLLIEVDQGSRAFREFPDMAAGSTPRRYRDVDAVAVPWSRLPELIVVYEPLLGERIIFNPLSKPSWTASVASARKKWSASHDRPLKLAKTWSLDAVLAEMRQQLMPVDDAEAPAAGAARRCLQELQQLRGAMSASTSDGNLKYLQLRFQDKLRELVGFHRWRRPLLALLWRTQPFACQGAANDQVPFMVVADAELFRRDKYAACRINRLDRLDLGDVLVDFEALQPLNMRSLPRYLNFADYQGRPTLFWNLARELNVGQITSLQVSPLLQHAYAQHVAQEWQRKSGVRPAVYVTSYVKLNQHEMQQIVDSNVDLAATPRKWLRHNSWIRPLENDTSTHRQAAGRWLDVGRYPALRNVLSGVHSGTPRRTIHEQARVSLGR